MHAKAIADLMAIQAQRLALEVPAPTLAPVPAQTDSPDSAVALRAFWSALGEEKFMEICGGNKGIASLASSAPGVCTGTALGEAPAVAKDVGDVDMEMDAEFFKEDAEAEVDQCGADATPEQVADRRKRVASVAQSKLSAVKKIRSLKSRAAKAKP